MFKRSSDGDILCESCLTPQDQPVAAELFPSFFPGTFHRLTCTGCGARPAAGAEATAPAVAESDPAEG